MDKYFVCLANSYKHGNRCLAGVLVEKVNVSFYIAKNEYKEPIWIRPIDRNSDGGAVPNEIALNINCGDIVLMHNAEDCPNGAQQENCYYDSLEVVGTFDLSLENVSNLVNKYRKVIFGNKGKAVMPEKYNSLSYSLMFIHAENVTCYLEPRENKKSQPRMIFTFKENKYDLPITDPIFRHIVEDSLEYANAFSEYFLVLSLGIENEDWHSKLIGNVLTF